MSEHPSPTPKAQQALLKAIKALTGMSAKMVFYGSALLGIAAVGGLENIPTTLSVLGSTLGINALYSILERIALQEEISDAEIRKTVEEVINASGIESLVTSDEFQRVVAHVFRQFDLLNYAIHKGETNIVHKLSEQFAEHNVIFEEFKNDLSVLREQNEDIQKSIQGIDRKIDKLSQSPFPVEFIDEKIEGELKILRMSSFFAEFDRKGFSLDFAERLLNGSFFNGKPSVKSQALAWCARILSVSDELPKAEEYLTVAKKLGTTPECEIAQAFIYSQKGEKSDALSSLNKITSPSSRSASLMIVAHHEGAEEAINWLKIAGIDITDLDADGKFFILAKLLEIKKLDLAQDYLKTITDNDLLEAPVLHQTIAMIHLLQAVPLEFSAVVLSQVPLNTAHFPLASSAEALRGRREAYKYFLTATETAQQLNCSQTASLYEEYALWLELRDPNTASDGLKKLEDKLRGNELNLRFVPLALQFGVSLDIEKVEKEVQRQIALNGGNTYETAFTRFALAFERKSPEDAADYIDLHFNTLSQFIKKEFLLSNQLHLLISAKKIEQARRVLNALEEEGLSDIERKRNEVSIAKIEGEDSLQLRENLYEETGLLTDLISLIDELVGRGYWGKVADYCQILFENTNDIKDAERLINALHQVHQSKRIIIFVEEHTDLLSQSVSLQMFYCWALFNEGEFVKADTEIKKLSDFQEDQNYRALQVSLALSSGNWNSLLGLITQVNQDKDKKSAHELLEMAQLACYLDVPIAKDLLRTAAQKGGDDAQILVQAYSLASSIGWEDDDTHQWMQRAIALSDSNGPIQKVSMRELADQMPDWNRRESQTWEQFQLGEIPMMVVGQSLRKSQAELMLFPAFGNSLEKDPRKRIVVPGYSGLVHANQFGYSQSIGLDVTALYTLSFLGILDTTIQSFDEVYIPHSTLRWLFDEKQKVAFHQPKRIQDAHFIHDLLGKGGLRVIVPVSTPDSELADQIGDELASLIADAEKKDKENDVQKVVVRSSPVHRVMSFMDEEADLTEHYEHLVSCQSVVNWLRKNGEITAKAEERALAYLQLQEKPWPQQPAIEEKAFLYLDDVTVSYFLHLGILNKLSGAGFTVFISERKSRETNALIAYEKVTDNAKNVIENIRSVLNTSIQTGKVKVDRLFRFPEKEDLLLLEQPSMSLNALAKRVDAMIVDDRFFNQHGLVEGEQAKALLFSTLDILDMLAARKIISDEDRFDYRMKLRRAGYFFIPLEVEELLFPLLNSAVRDGQVIETLELRAIRENILHVRMSNWLQVPKETPWADSTLRIVIQVLHKLWKTDRALEEIEIRSNWLLKQLNFNGWAYLLGKDGGKEFIKTGRATYLLMLFLPADDMPIDKREKYWSWVEPRVLAPLKEQFPELYALIVQVLQEQILRLANTDLANGELR